MSDSGLKFTVNDGYKQSVTTLVAYVDKFAMIFINYIYYNINFSQSYKRCRENVLKFVVRSKNMALKILKKN